MKKFLTRYTDIMNRYKNGEFGNSQLTLYDILLKAGEINILDKMSLSEIQSLTQNSSGILKQMFFFESDKKIKEVEKMKKLEEDLASLEVKEGNSSQNMFDEDLAKKFNLEVIFCNPSEMPEDVEATLSPPYNDKYFGVIKVLKNADITKFSYVHEIIHYLKDVGKGKKVSKTYTRKRRGKTDSEEEQDINYLTAATIMPFEQVSELLNDYEKLNYDDEKDFIANIAKKYGQTEDVVLRRFIEVRKLVDYQNLHV